ADRSMQAGFGDLMLENTRTGAAIGNASEGVVIAATATDLSQAPLRETGQPLDVGLQGDGFLAVKTAAGTSYTRSGQLALDAKGTLVTATGYPVLDDQGRTITLQPGAKVTIGADGSIAGGPRIGVVSLTNAVKIGDSLFAGKPGARPTGT